MSLAQMNEDEAKNLVYQALVTLTSKYTEASDIYFSEGDVSAEAASANNVRYSPKIVSKYLADLFLDGKVDRVRKFTAGGDYLTPIYRAKISTGQQKTVLQKEIEKGGTVYSERIG